MKTIPVFAALALLVPLAVSSPDPVPAAQETGTAFAVDSGHSGVLFRTKHLGLSYFYGQFNKVSGSVNFDTDDPTACSVEIEIDADSVDTNNDNRDGHLKSPDFFSVKEFPTITFKSAKVAEKDGKLLVTGELALRGKTKTITVAVEHVGSGDTPFGDFRAGFEARFTIDPKDFGLVFFEKNPKMLGPEVELTVSLECIRQ